jgi:hypothetical protein
VDGLGIIQLHAQPRFAANTAILRICRLKDDSLAACSSEAAANFSRLVSQAGYCHRRLNDCTILGHGRTKEEALDDLEKRVAGFVEFLKRSRQETPEPLR